MTGRRERPATIYGELASKSFTTKLVTPVPTSPFEISSVADNQIWMGFPTKVDETEQAWQLSFVENEMDVLLLLSKGMKQTLLSKGEESTCAHFSSLCTYCHHSFVWVYS